ncbi:lipase family protein [Nocardia violaceofusca]|uniref:lipase family protein n=1 Tax=Nocardia violaceofusca TaxID=941182 RepID=UPI000AA03787|nr:IPT/TIG domain-containing protein [Nocardia violaceofusca]
MSSAATVNQNVDSMMTLCAFSPIAAVPLPDGETSVQQQQRMLDGIRSMMAKTPGLDSWKVVWLGMSSLRANMAFVVQNVNDTSELAVCFRGTVFSSLIDLAEDFEVFTQVPFPQGGTPPAGSKPVIAKGAAAAFDEIMSAKCVLGLPGGSGTLVSALQTLCGPSKPATVHLTGHSLGGCLVTTAALFLQSQFAKFNPKVAFDTYTFAAPTAGNQDFATWFDTQFPHGQAIWNKYDVVANVWWNLGPGPTSIQSFFPAPGPYASECKDDKGRTVQSQIQDLAQKLAESGVSPYVQPTQQPPMNTDYARHSTDALGKTEKDWMGQLAYQHANNTYLTLLGAPTVNIDVPQIKSLSPNKGPGGTTVTIEVPSTAAFASACVVYFGSERGTDVKVGINSITATAPRHLGIETVAVSITNLLTISDTKKTPANEFTYI